MTTEQYSIGYDEGYQAGWNAAMDAKPAQQQEPVAGKHQAFIDSLPSDMEDKMFEQIHYWARQSYARHQRSTRGQTITAADSSDNHIIWAALRWAKENAATPPAQQEPVAWLRKSDLVELRACNYMRIGADSPSIWAPNAPDEPSPDMELIAVYTSPPAQRTWVELTDEEREIASWTDGSFGAGARWAEAKLKEKNNGN